MPTFLLKIDGITGESQFDGYSDYSHVEKWHFGVTQSATFGSGTSGGAGATVSAQDLEATIFVDKGTAKRLEGCASGKHFKTATLVTLKASGESKPIEHHKITLSDVIISKCVIGHEPAPPGSKTTEFTVEQTSLNYAKIAFEYKEQKKDGSAGASVEGGFDLAKHKAGK
jgi:type VI secretion system secreted protein Hcp